MLAPLALPLPFSLDTVVRSHGWYDLPPFDYDRNAGLLRTHVEVGPAEAAEIRFRVRNGKLETSADRLDSRALRDLTRRVFSLDLDFARAHEAFAPVPEIAGALVRRGGRMLRAPTLFEDSVKMLFTTNCSWAATPGPASSTASTTRERPRPRIARSPGVTRGLEPTGGSRSGST